MIGGWPFVIAAYAITAIGTAGLAAWAIVAMRRAEALTRQTRPGDR